MTRPRVYLHRLTPGQSAWTFYLELGRFYVEINFGRDPRR